MGHTGGTPLSFVPLSLNARASFHRQSGVIIEPPLATAPGGETGYQDDAEGYKLVRFVTVNHDEVCSTMNAMLEAWPTARANASSSGFTISNEIVTGKNARELEI